MLQLRSCAKVCDREFNKKHIGVNLISLQFCVHEKGWQLFAKIGTKFVLFPGDSRAIARSLDESRKLMIL